MEMKENEKSLEVLERSKGKLLLELFPNAPLGATCKAWQENVSNVPNSCFKGVQNEILTNLKPFKAT
jgi:hypothetical protein